MKRGRKIFWGILFILGAIALIIGQMGYLEGIGFWSILLTIGLVGVLVDGIWNKNFWMILFSIAFLIIANDELLGLEAITPWPVLGAALLGSVGMQILFPQKKNNRHNMIYKNGGKKGTDKDVLFGEQIGFANTFGESVKYLDGNEINEVYLENTFGSLNVYFNNALPKNGCAEVSVENVFGSTLLFIPADWKVVMNVNTVFGDVNEKGRNNAQGTNTIHITGKTVFGEVGIRYI